jgi:large subunit ribosomal protein L9
MSNDKIQVVMLMDVKNIWRKNEILNVAPTYAKNVLIAKWYAKIADKNTIDKLAADQRKKQAGHDSLLSNVESIAQTLKTNWFQISGKVSPAGKLYAKIDNKTVAQELSTKFGFAVDPSILKCDKIDHVGEYDVKVVFEKIKSSFTLTVIWTK